MNPLKIVFFTIFIDLLGFGIIIPIQPFYAQTFGVTPTVITLLGASYSLMQFLFSSKLGRLSDRIGRRPVMLISVALIAIGYFLFATAESVMMLFISRMISGLGGANLGAAQAIIADSTAPEDRAKGMGLIGAAFGLGFIFGPALGGFLGQYSPTTPIFAAGILAVFNLILIASLLPETRRPETRRPETRHPETQEDSLQRSNNNQSPLQGDWRTLIKLPNIRSLFVISLTFTFAFALMEQTIGLYIEATWVKGSGLTPDEQLKRASALTAYFLILIGVAATIVQGGLIGRLSKRFGEVNLCRVGIAIVCLTFILIPLIGRAGSFGLLLLIALLMATGTGVLHPSRNSLLSRGVPVDLQGSTLGMNQSLGALGRVIGPAIAGILFEISIDLPFWVGGICMLLTLYFSFQLRPIQRE